MNETSIPIEISLRPEFYFMAGMAAGVVLAFVVCLIQKTIQRQQSKWRRIEHRLKRIQRRLDSIPRT